MFSISKESISPLMTMGGRLDFSTVPEMINPLQKYSVSGASGAEFAFKASDHKIELRLLEGMGNPSAQTIGLYGEVDTGLLNWVIYTRDENYVQHPDLNGTDFYRAAFLYLSMFASISAIKGWWHDGSNLARYLENRARGLDVVNSARSTWAGRMASEQGYTEVILPNGDDQNGYNQRKQGYYFHFEKP